MTTLKDTDTLADGPDLEPDEESSVKTKTAKPVKKQSKKGAKKAAKRLAEEEVVDEADIDVPDDEADVKPERRPIDWSRVLAYGVLPGLALVLAVAAGYLKWLDGSTQDSAGLRAETARVASEDSVALLSYRADSADKDLGAARDRLTGDFKDAYTALIREVVVPGAKEKHITATVKVGAAAPVSVSESHAVVLVFANQSVTIGQGVPTDTKPVLRVVLDRVNGRWLVSHFDPV
jgi:Mce-associated membrane protein